MSHEQALGQCSEWITYSGLQTVAVGSTADGAKASVESDGSIATICSQLAARENGLEIVSTEIINPDNANTTTFLVFSRESNGLGEGKHETVLFFFPENKPGALYSALGPAALAGRNLQHIRDFSINNELAFYAVLEGKPSEVDVDWILTGMRKLCKKLLVLGSYKIG